MKNRHFKIREQKVDNFFFKVNFENFRRVKNIFYP